MNKKKAVFCFEIAKDTLVVSRERLDKDDAPLQSKSYWRITPASRKRIAKVARSHRSYPYFIYQGDVRGMIYNAPVTQAQADPELLAALQETTAWMVANITAMAACVAEGTPANKDTLVKEWLQQNKSLQYALRIIRQATQKGD